MTGARRHRHRPRARRWWPAAVALAVLAVVGGGWWLLPGSGDPVPAAATSAAPSPTTTAAATTAAPAPTTTAATTTTAPPTTTAPAPTTTAPPTTPPPPPPAPAPAPAPAAPAPDPGVEGEVVALVNAERATAGCGPVASDAGLAGVARAHSADMRDRGYFSHTTPDGLSPWDRAAAAGVAGASAENIAQGYPDAASVVAGWMDSPGHRANILDCSNTRLGVGVAQGPGGPWWTQLFGR